jgi:hypothetical protein
MTPKGEHLFIESQKARYGEQRQSRPVFLQSNFTGNLLALEE